MTALSIKEVLEQLLRNAYNEGFNEGMNEVTRRVNGGKSWFDVQAKHEAKLVAALATLSQPAGEKREAIATTLKRELEDCQSAVTTIEENRRHDNETQNGNYRFYQGRVVSLNFAINVLASGLVQDEAGWRDISSAPKDGEIIYINKFGEIGFCHWSEALHSDQESIWWDEQKCDECVPRYWLPRTCLPAPPTKARGDTES